MTSIFKDFRYAARAMMRRPGIFLLAVASLALGIGANSMVFTLVNAVLIRDVPAVEPERLVEIYSGRESGLRLGPSSYRDFLDLREGTRAFSGVIAYNLNVTTYDDGGTTELLFGEEVSASYFDLLGLRPVLGRGFLPEEDRTPSPVAVLGHRFWQQRFGGDPGVLDQTLDLSGVSFRVVGVAPKPLKGSFPGFVAAYWVPLAMHDAIAAQPLDRRSPRTLFVKGRLRDEVTLVQAQTQLDNLAGRLAETYPETNEGIIMTAVPSQDVAVYPGLDSSLFGAAGFLMVVVGLVLVTACANVANLLLARAAERRKEFAIRLAIGAGRGRLIRLLLAESLLLGLAGALIGLLVALWVARLLVTSKPSLPIPLALDLAPDVRVFGFTLALALLTALLCGLVPALQASRLNLVSGLKDKSDGLLGRGHRKLGLRNLLVVTQVALSMLLLIGTGLFLRSLGQAAAVDPGFTLRNGVAAQIALGIGNRYSEEEGRAFYQRLVERMSNQPGVRSATLVQHLPLGLTIQAEETWIEGRPLPADGHAPDVDLVCVAPGYFETLGIPLLRGRDFTWHDERDAPGVVIVNETAARRFWADESPLGKRLRFSADGPFSEVVGVVRDGKYRSLGEEPRPFIFSPWSQNYSQMMSLVVASQVDDQQMLAQVRRELEAMDPNLPIVDLRTIADHAEIALFPARLGATLLAAFGGLGLLLVTAGVYGVVAQAVARRTREIGVRIAVGASPSSLLWLVVKEGMILVGLGMAIGVGLALAVTHLLKSLLFGISASDPVTFLVVALVLATIALGANLIPALRVMRVHPTVVLRYD